MAGPVFGEQARVFELQNYAVGTYGILVHNENQGLPNAPRGNPALAKKIANGHAYDKHIVQANEFPGVNTQAEFEEVIGDAIERAQANGSVRTLSKGRTAYFDDSTGLVVIENPAAADGGTAFRPLDGKKYFEETLK